MKLPSAAWPPAKRLAFWTVVDVSVNENVRVVITMACLAISGLGGRRRRVVSLKRNHSFKVNLKH